MLIHKRKIPDVSNLVIELVLQIEGEMPDSAPSREYASENAPEALSSKPLNYSDNRLQRDNRQSIGRHVLRIRSHSFIFHLEFNGPKQEGAVAFAGNRFVTELK